jgi:hypothetical protein
MLGAGIQMKLRHESLKLLNSRGLRLRELRKGGSSCIQPGEPLSFEGRSASMSNGFLYVAVTFTPSNKKSEPTHLRNLACFSGFAARYCP